jgi:hypothetical protein
VVRFNATTLWHIDAAEWAPSTASLAEVTASHDEVRFVSRSRTSTYKIYGYMP